MVVVVDDDTDCDCDSVCCKATCKFPATVSSSSSVVCWNNTPHRSCGGTLSFQRHSTAMFRFFRNDAGAERPARHMASVVFPAPLFPARQTQDPAVNSNDTSLLPNGHLGPCLDARKDTNGDDGDEMFVIVERTCRWDCFGGVSLFSISTFFFM